MTTDPSVSQAVFNGVAEKYWRTRCPDMVASMEREGTLAHHVREAEREAGRFVSEATQEGKDYRTAYRKAIKIWMLVGE